MKRRLRLTAEALCPARTDDYLTIIFFSSQMTKKCQSTKLSPILFWGATGRFISTFVKQIPKSHILVLLYFS